MLDLDNLSIENLERIKKVLKITLDELEIRKTDGLVGNKILIKKLEKEGVYYEDAEDILNNIDGIEVVNTEFNQMYRGEGLIDPYYIYGITKDDLAKNLFWTGSPSRIREIKKEVDKKIEIKTGAEKKQQTESPENFKINVKDREIWVSNYLLSKPHAVGSNFEFFEYLRLQPANTKIERKNLPSKYGDLSLKEQVKNKGFIKILNELGFKGEVLKAFFPKRGKDILVYRGDKITKKDLEKSGVKISLFIKQLELAHLKNNPE